MKIQEIVDYYYNSDINCLKVSFRLKTDQLNQIRESEFDLDNIKKWGYELGFNENIISESKEFYFEDENENEYDFFEGDYEETLEIDEDSLLDFLNEYYTENPDKLPVTSLF